METIDNASADVVPPPLAGEAEAQRLEPADQPEVPGLLSDCRLMLRYASANAFALTPELLSFP